MKYRDYVTLNEVVRGAITSELKKLYLYTTASWIVKWQLQFRLFVPNPFMWLLLLVIALPCKKSFSFYLQRFHLLCSLHVRHTYCHRPSGEFVYVFWFSA